MTTRSIEPLVIGGMVVVLGIVTLFADANGGLIPGGGPTKSDCYVELSVDGITNPSERVQSNKQVLITDGDVGDQGPCGDNKCNVSVGACINQTDPNLSDCTPPASLDKLTVKGALTVSVPQLLTGSACGAFSSPAGWPPTARSGRPSRPSAASGAGSSSCRPGRSAPTTRS